MKQTGTTALTIALGLALLSACSGSDGSQGGGDGAKSVTLVTHDSFRVSKKLLREFTEKTGYKVRILRGGDAGAAVNQTVLNKGNPQGDVFFGVDNTFLSRPLDEGVFAPYEAKGLDKVPGKLQLDAEQHRVTPIDSGDICVNYDRKYFADKKLDPPRTLADLVKPDYKNLLVTENAGTSSPGLGFLLATVQKYGADGWQDYWKKLRANGVEVVDGWEQAYNDRFSGSGASKGKGDRPLVVSYASSPPAEVLGKDPQPKQAPTGVAEETCFRQVEFAGLLDGASNVKGGKALLDFMLGKSFQQELPLSMFVNPARGDVELPELFTTYGVTVDNPARMEPARIGKNRDQWVKSWTSLVLK
ncbi:thiamine ABC transporter substrate-binding protein [Streptomyces sp. N2-109]|uniref:Thiamine ABC transporter substrate-binding protein n=1 Tax=Streptomyces gossypii TaxID=2883101 RepID=A0ABT2K214_9ACTN|nr:thiamine ABC transporter substrate-binding protein [Streptomyces gossypii]MCT2594207.1 thiamine ABC transporter substrate-binding protein [Streptomyces gossypii]